MTPPELDEKKLQIVKNELSTQGLFYRYFLREECIGAFSRQDSEQFSANVQLYQFSCSPPLLAEYSDMVPRESTEHVRWHLYIAQKIPQLIYRAEPATKGETKYYTELIALLEPERKRGTRFLNRRYSQGIEDALELLRGKVMQILQALFESDIYAFQNIQDYLLTWYYHKVLTLPSCFHFRQETFFIQAVQENQPALMLACMDLKLLVKIALQDPPFLELITGRPIEQLKRVIATDEPLLVKTLIDLVRTWEYEMVPPHIANFNIDAVSLYITAYFAGWVPKPDSKPES